MWFLFHSIVVGGRSTSASHPGSPDSVSLCFLLRMSSSGFVSVVEGGGSIEELIGLLAI